MAGPGPVHRRGAGDGVQLSAQQQSVQPGALRCAARQPVHMV